MINYYCEEELIDETENDDLEEYVNEKGYLKEEIPEYQEILKVVMSSQRLIYNSLVHKHCGLKTNSFGALLVIQYRF